jgi:predicted ArsR family transcriptional regulator
VSVPPRAYDAASRLLAEVVEQAGLDHRLQAAARAAGAADAAGGAVGDVVEVLRERGYQPFADGAAVRLNNCPFHALAEEFPALVCGMNLALIGGLIEGSAEWSAAMQPLPEGCCVALISKNNSH